MKKIKIKRLKTNLSQDNDAARANSIMLSPPASEKWEWEKSGVQYCL